jgi:hypothetical protein
MLAPANAARQGSERQSHDDDKAVGAGTSSTLASRAAMTLMGAASTDVASLTASSF